MASPCGKYNQSFQCCGLCKSLLCFAVESLLGTRKASDCWCGVRSLIVRLRTRDFVIGFVQVLGKHVPVLVYICVPWWSCESYSCYVGFCELFFVPAYKPGSVQSLVWSFRGSFGKGAPNLQAKGVMVLLFCKSVKDKISVRVRGRREPGARDAYIINYPFLITVTYVGVS